MPPATVDRVARTQIEIPYIHGHDYGMGTNFLSGTPLALAVVPDHSPPGAPGGVLTFRASRITSTEDVEDKLGIHADASYGVGFFGSISARFDFARSCKVHTESLFYAISAQVTLAFESIDEPRLTESAAAAAADPAAFTRRYGDSFIRGMATGGLFVGVLQIDASSSEEVSAMASELSGAIGLFDASAAVTIQNSVSRHNASAFATFYCEGGDLEAIAPFTGRALDPSALLEASTTWQQTIRDNAVPYTVTLAPMVIAAGGVAPPNAAEIEHAQDVLVRCAKLRSRLIDGLNTLDYVATHAARYVVDPTVNGGHTIGALQNDFGDAIDLVARAASVAMRDPAGARMPEALFADEGKVVPAIPPGLYSAAGIDKPVAVPNLAGARTWNECVERLQSVGLNGTREDDPNIPIGPFEVLGQRPAAGELAPTGSPVTVRTRQQRLMIGLLGPSFL